MTDTSTDIPGVRGHTRSSWHDESHLYGLLRKLIKKHPKAPRDELEELYLEKVKGPNFRATAANEALIDEALLRSFALDLDKLQKRRSQKSRRRVSEAAIAAGTEAVKSVVLLDLVEPNGKKLRDCTGAECRVSGGWRIKIAERIGDDGIVGDKLSEAQLAKIFAASQ